MEFQLIIFLYIYYAFLVIWGILFVVALYHMFRFGFKSLANVLVLIVFIGVASLMLNASLELVHQIDWTEKVTIFENIIDYKLLF